MGVIQTLYLDNTQNDKESRSCRRAQGGLSMGKGYSPEQIVRKLRQAEGKLATGSTISEVARELGIKDGRRLKMMPVVDEYTRECLSLEGQRSIKACGVIDTLRRLSIERGEPDYIRSDNGPEFIAEALKEWLAVSGVKTLYIEPGAPWENAYSETFISRLRDELLDRELFVNLKEAQVLLEDYRKHYNHNRPHGALSISNV
jgi:hypothetical protein